MSKQRGFTMIELVIVIVILGILAAVAIPRFINLSGEARQAATDGIAGSMAAAMAINYAGCSAGSTACVTVDDCNDTNSILVSAPVGYTTAPSVSLATHGATATCTVERTDGDEFAEFAGIGAILQ